MPVTPRYCSRVVGAGGGATVQRRRASPTTSFALASVALLIALPIPPIASRSRGMLGAQAPRLETSSPRPVRRAGDRAPTTSTRTVVDSLIAQALLVSPQLRAAEARVAAARARIRPSASLPDPMLMAGLVNQPLGSGSPGAMGHGEGPEPMTMRMIGVEQSIPFAGKRSLRREAAEHEAEASRFAHEDVRRQVRLDVERAYFELAFVDHALELVGRNADVLATLISVTESRYSTGGSDQQDVLRARVEATRLAETASDLTEQRVALVAQLNALLNRASDAPVEQAAVPEVVVRRAAPASADAIRFASPSLGSRASDSPLRSLAQLQDAAVRGSAQLREHEAMIVAQRVRVALARKEHLPDLDVSIQYGQRGGGLPDMLTATVAIPLPVFKARKQDQLVAEADAQLTALDAEHHQLVNTLRADVARIVSETERARTRLALAVKATLPQSRAALASATAGYQSGRTALPSVLDAQSTVFALEADYYRALSDFAKNVAELRRITGKEVFE